MPSLSPNKDLEQEQRSSKKSYLNFKAVDIFFRNKTYGVYMLLIVCFLGCFLIAGLCFKIYSNYKVSSSKLNFKIGRLTITDFMFKDKMTDETNNDNNNGSNNFNKKEFKHQETAVLDDGYRNGMEMHEDDDDLEANFFSHPEMNSNRCKDKAGQGSMHTVRKSLREEEVNVFSSTSRPVTPTATGSGTGVSKCGYDILAQHSVGHSALSVVSISPQDILQDKVTNLLETYSKLRYETNVGIYTNSPTSAQNCTRKSDIYAYVSPILMSTRRDLRYLLNKSNTLLEDDLNILRNLVMELENRNHSAIVLRRSMIASRASVVMTESPHRISVCRNRGMTIKGSLGHESETSLSEKNNDRQVDIHAADQSLPSTICISEEKCSGATIARGSGCATEAKIKAKVIDPRLPSPSSSESESACAASPVSAASHSTSPTRRDTTSHVSPPRSMGGAEAGGGAEATSGSTSQSGRRVYFLNCDSL